MEVGFVVVVIFGLWLALAGTKENVLPTMEYTGLDIDKKDHAMWTSRFLFHCTIFISKTKNTRIPFLCNY